LRVVGNATVRVRANTLPGTEPPRGRPRRIGVAPALLRTAETYRALPFQELLLRLHDVVLDFDRT